MRSLGSAVDRVVGRLKLEDTEEVSDYESAGYTKEEARDNLSAERPRRRRGKAVQPILGIVASEGKRITPSQRELVRRAGTYLSIQQQMAARRRARE